MTRSPQSTFGAAVRRKNSARNSRVLVILKQRFASNNGMSVPLGRSTEAGTDVPMRRRRLNFGGVKKLERGPPLPPVLRKNVIPGALRARNVQESDSKGVVRGKSVQRAPVSRSAKDGGGRLFCENGSKYHVSQTLLNDPGSGSGATQSAVRRRGGEPSSR